MSTIRYEPLPNTLFLVRVPIVCTYTSAEVDMFGLPMSTDNLGNEFRDTYKDLVTVMLNVDRMIDIYIQGYPIYIVNKEDSAKIFSILEEYLAGTVNNPTAFLNQANVEEDRLNDIERFAEEMFGLNKNTIVSKILNDNKNIGFGMDGFDLMPMKTPNQVMKETYTNKGNVVRSITFDPNVNNKNTVKKLPMKHTAYPHIPEPDVKINNRNTVNNYAYIYDTLPDVDLDIAKVTRRTNYRKVYK